MRPWRLDVAAACGISAMPTFQLYSNGVKIKELCGEARYIMRASSSLRVPVNSPNTLVPHSYEKTIPERVSRHREAETHTRTRHTQTFWPNRTVGISEGAGWGMCVTRYDIFTKEHCLRRAPLTGADKVALEALAKEGDDM